MANLPPVLLIPVAICLRRRCRGIVDTGGKYATGINNASETGFNDETGINDTGGKFAAGVVETGANFAAGVIDTSGKFATGVVDTGGAP